MASSTPLFVSDPEKWLHETSEKYQLFCLVIFRGSWCSYDKHYLTKLAKDPKPDGTYMMAWTSEGEEGAKKAEELWNLKELGYDLVLGDETAALAKYFIEEELLPNLIIQPLSEATLDADKMDGEAPGYPNGLVQPAMVVYAHMGNMVMHWEAKVEEANAFGAANRPLPSQMWEEVEHRKSALDHGSAVMPINGQRLKTCTHIGDV